MLRMAQGNQYCSYRYGGFEQYLPIPLLPRDGKLIAFATKFRRKDLPENAPLFRATGNSYLMRFTRNPPLSDKCYMCGEVEVRDM